VPAGFRSTVKVKGGKRIHNSIGTFAERRFIRMKILIGWCNDNAGFIAALQTIATILLSIIAVGVSIYFSRLQYKKELKIYSGLDYDSEGRYSLELYLVNTGNVPLFIKNIQVVKECQNQTTDALGLGFWEASEELNKRFLVPKMHDSFKLFLENCNANEDKENTNIKIIIDTEEKIFVYRIDWTVG
jgi:hypothetical protein